MIDVIPFHPAHLNEPELRKGLDVFGNFTPEQYFNFVGSSPCGSIRCGNQILACLGIAQFDKTRGHAWTILTRKVIEEFGFILHRTVFKNLDKTAKEMGLSRVECTVKEGEDKIIEWVERMGFEREGLLRCMNEKRENFYFYSKIYGGI